MAARDITRLVQTPQNLRRFSYGPRPATLQQVLNAGYITENQPITITGDVDGSGTTAINAQIVANAVGTTEIANANVTYAKIQNTTAARLIGNPTGSPAPPSEISLGANLSFAGSVLNAAGGASGLSGMTAGQIPIAASATTITSSGNLSGDITTSGSLATTIANNAVTTVKVLNSNITYAKIQNVTNNRILGNTSGSAAAPSEIALPLAVSNGGTGAATLPGPTGVHTSYNLARARLNGVGAGAVIADPNWGAYSPADGGLVGGSSSASQACYIEFGRSLGTPAAPAACGVGTALGSIQFDGYGNGVWNYARALIMADAQEAYTASAQGTRLIFNTTPPGVALNAAMTLYNGMIVGAPTGGHKGIGTVNATSVQANGVVLTSDDRLKRDIEPLPPTLALVRAVEPRQFRWNPLPDPSGGPADFAERQRWGFVSQEIEMEAQRTGVPFAGLEGDDELGLDVGALIATLWQALREATARIEVLEAR